MSLADNEFLKVSEVAHYLHVVPMTVYRLIKAGKLQATRINVHYRITRAQLEEFVRGNRV